MLEKQGYHPSKVLQRSQSEPNLKSAVEPKQVQGKLAPKRIFLLDKLLMPKLLTWGQKDEEENVLRAGVRSRLAFKMEVDKTEKHLTTLKQKRLERETQKAGKLETWETETVEREKRLNQEKELKAQKLEFENTIREKVLEKKKGGKEDVKSEDVKPWELELELNELLKDKNLSGEEIKLSRELLERLKMERLIREGKQALEVIEELEREHEAAREQAERERALQEEREREEYERVLAGQSGLLERLRARREEREHEAAREQVRGLGLTEWLQVGAAEQAEWAEREERERVLAGEAGLLEQLRAEREERAREVQAGLIDWLLQPQRGWTWTTRAQEWTELVQVWEEQTGAPPQRTEQEWLQLFTGSQDTPSLEGRTRLRETFRSWRGLRQE